MVLFPAEISNRKGSHLEGRGDSFIFGHAEFESAVGNPGCFPEDKIPIFHSVSITTSLFCSPAAISIATFSTVFLHKVCVSGFNKLFQPRLGIQPLLPALSML